jgi:hypothetical protein
VPVYDPDSMGTVAGQVGKLKDEFEKSKGKMTGHEGPDNPFGTMGGSKDVHGAMGSATSRVHDEFDAGGKLMSATSDFLRRAAGLMDETDEVGASDLKWHEQS